MTDVYNQRRMASECLKVGINRVWIDPDQLQKVSAAITREEIRRLISKGIISKKPEIGTSRTAARERADKKRKGRLKKEGSKRGASGRGKRDWINTIRPLRRAIKAMLLKGEISKETYKELYAKARGGFFRSKTHLKLHLQKGGKEK